MKVLLALAFIVGTFANPGGVKVALNAKTLTELFRAELPAFAKSFTTGVPPIYHPFKVLLTNGYANLTNVVLNRTEIDASKASISLENPDTIVATIGSLSLFIECDYDIKFGLLHFRGHGSFVVEDSKVVLPTVLTPGMLNSYNIAFHNSTFEFGKLKVKTENLLLSTAIKTAYAVVKKKLQPSIGAGFDQAGQYISVFTLGLNYFPTLVGGLNIDTHPTGPVVVSSKFASVAINGTVFNKTEGNQFVGTMENDLPDVDPLVDSNQVLLSDYFWNSMLFTRFGKLNQEIAELPDGTPVTSGVISEVYANFTEKYDGLPTRVSVQAFNVNSGPISISTTDLDLILDYSVQINTQVQDENGWTNAVVTQATFTLSGSTIINENKLTLRFTQISVSDVSTLMSTFEVEDELVEANLSYLSNQQLGDINDQFIELPVVLPSKFMGLPIKNQTLVLEDAYTTYIFAA